MSSMPYLLTSFLVVGARADPKPEAKPNTKFKPIWTSGQWTVPQKGDYVSQCPNQIVTLYQLFMALASYPIKRQY